MLFLLLLWWQLQNLLYKRKNHTGKYLIIKEMLPLEKPHLLCAVILLKIRLAVYQLILCSEKAPHQFLLLRSNALKRTLLYLLELLDKFFVDLEITSAILPFISKLTPAHTTKC